MVLSEFTAKSRKYLDPKNLVPRKIYMFLQLWVIIGKDKDLMKPQDVQYAQALNPPYHLASFSKMAGNSTKGKSATDKNSMVFVVKAAQEVSVSLSVLVCLCVVKVTKQKVLI